jgi:glyoxylase-like metal-dependent hydrolase (beta-lactamase superfamily II)
LDSQVFTSNIPPFQLVCHTKLQLISKTQKIADDLFLIPLSPPLTGFSEFISAWLYRGKITFLVDVGPSTTATDLLRALQELNIDHLDYILLTHIHLDHAGAIGQITDAFPQTPIICHKAGISHLTEPSQLWGGTKKVLGSMALSYGPIQPVDANRLSDVNQFRAEGVTPIITPGHAPHHVSYQTDNYLFAGETGGIYVSLPQRKFYLRPATPPRFFLDIALQSVDALIASQPKTICYAHFGINDDASMMLEAHRGQLLLWKALIKDEIQSPSVKDRTAACLKRLLKEDPLMATFDQLRPDIQERERYFLKNSINGYLGYLSSDVR